MVLSYDPTADFDFRNPDYVGVFRQRTARLQAIRAAQRRDPFTVPRLKRYYKDNPWVFITDWGVTYDPRNVDADIPSTVPFILFPRQIEWVQWFLRRWRSRSGGLTEKSRDMGVTWLCASTACALCLFYDEMSIGFGSRKEEYVDGGLKAIFPKARTFVQHLPSEFRGGWLQNKHSSHMKLFFPETKSTMSGEAGDNIGRGDREGIYIVDEAAHLQHPEMVDAALSNTTNCRIDVSSVKGMANSFAQKRFSPAFNGTDKVFTFFWRSDPRKDDEWYAQQKIDNPDPVVIAQEIDIDYSASVEGVVIESAWIRASIDAHLRLNLEPSGTQELSFDVADEGADKNVIAGRYGILLNYMEQWSGKGSDIYKSVERTTATADRLGLSRVHFDSDGLGAGVRGIAEKINSERRLAAMQPVVYVPYRGSAAVDRPDAQDEHARQNKDNFQNAKAQHWWRLRGLFQNTYRWIEEGVPCDPDTIISIDSKLPLLTSLMAELVQPTYDINNTGKKVIDKKPDGMASPNLADAVMILFGGSRRGIRVSPATLARFNPVLPRTLAETNSAQMANVAKRRIRISQQVLERFRAKS